jgi:hypothetical protein
MPRLAALAVALAGIACGTGRSSGPLRAADPAQTGEDQPLAARAEVAGVSFVARVGSWRGWPRDLEQRLTPVAITVANHAGRRVRMAPDTFSLAVAGGGRYSPMSQPRVSRAVSELAGSRRQRPPIRTPGTPGFDVPGDPYVSPQPRNTPVPGPGDWQGAFEASGTMSPGDRLQTVLYFDVPGASLDAATLVADVVDDSGARLGEVRLEFARVRG